MKRKRTLCDFRGAAAGTALMVALLPVDFSRAANAYAVKSGSWDSDIWSSKSGGIPESGLRPGTEDYDIVHFRQNGIRVSVHSDVGSLAQVFLNNTGAGTLLQLNAGARLDIRFLALAVGGGKSAVEVSGDAVLTVGDNGIRLAHGANGVGTMTISEGSVTVNGRFILSGKEGAGTLNLSSGSLATLSLESGLGAATFSWTGGALRVGESDLKKIENLGSGVLDIGGPDAVAANGFLHKGERQIYEQGPDATMRIDIESAKSYDHFISDGPSGQVRLKGMIEIHLLKGYRPRTGDRFDIISAAEITDEGIRLGGPAGAGFQVQVVNDGSGQVLRLVAK